jgi:hypothetical protein
MVVVVAAVMMGGHNSLSSALLWRYALDRLFFCELVNNWRSDAFWNAQKTACWNVRMFYYCGAASEQRAARFVVATGVLPERRLPRDVESLHPRACMEVPSPCASCKIC